MALFGKKTEETNAAATETAKPKVVAQPKLVAGRNLQAVLRKPRITEKAVRATDNNVYTFEVDARATKIDIRDAVKELYDVTPVKIRTVTQQPRRHVSRARGRVVKIKGIKKAYVYLKSGDRINLI